MARTPDVPIFLVFVVGLTGVAVSRPPKAGVLRAYEYSLPRMGTLFRITLYSASQAEAGKAAMAAFERVEQLEESMSDYRDQSELVRLSWEAVSAPRVVSPELFYVLDKSLQVSRLSGGAFDVTVGPVVQLWRQARRAGRLPDAAELAKAKAAVDYRNIELDPQARTVLLKRPDMKLDLGGIAKGYAAQQALELLAARGIRRALVAGGGDIALGAPPPDRAGWRIAIDDPSPEGQASPCTLVLHDVAIATSGAAHQFVDVGGHRYSHIINPADGMALKDSGSATVIAPDGAMADALGVALSVLPVSEGLRAIETVEGASAYIVRQTGPASAGWRRYSSRRFPQACGDVRRQ